MSIRTTFSLSGFGGGYELQCQKMLWRGVKHLESVRPPVEMWKNAKSSPNMYGSVITEGPKLKALEAAILHPGDDATGAMHQCVMQHLHFIHNNGLEKWATELSPHRDGKSFEYDDEAEAFVGNGPGSEPADPDTSGKKGERGKEPTGSVPRLRHKRHTGK